MKENELLREIDNIVRSADGLTLALARLQVLIADECGGAMLIIRPASGGAATSAPPAVCAFLESRRFPFRGLYVTPLNLGSRVAGTLVACIGTWGMPGDLLRRITDFAGQQLTELACRLALPAIEYMVAE